MTDDPIEKESTDTLVELWQACKKEGVFILWTVISGVPSDKTNGAEERTELDSEESISQ